MAIVLTMSRTVAPRDEVVDRLGQALEHRSDGDGAGRALHRLVGVVAGVEVGEHEHRGPPGDLGARHLRCCHVGVDRRVVLDGSVDLEVGSPLADELGRHPDPSTSAPDPDSPVEYESMATRGSIPNWAAVVAEAMAMSASCSTVGSRSTAQSP